MKKDIEIPEVEGVGIAIAKRDEGDNELMAYIINYNPFPLKSVIINSKGYGSVNLQGKKTTQFCNWLEDIPPRSFKPIEVIAEEVLELTNEFMLTYYVDKVIHDKKYVFLEGVVREDNFIDVSVLGKKGVLIK